MPQVKNFNCRAKALPMHMFGGHRYRLRILLISNYKQNDVAGMEDRLRKALKICVKKSNFFILCGEYAFCKNLESNKLTGNVCLCKSRKTGKIWLRKYLLRKILLENSRFLH